MPRKTPKKRVYTSAQPLPPPTWRPLSGPAPTALLARICPQSHGDHASADWWHATLDAADQLAATHKAYESRILSHNHDVAALSNALDLPARDRTGTGIIQFDAAEMQRRIAAANARHTNKAPRNHTSANRQLAFHCPVCSVQKTKKGGRVEWSNTIRASNPMRIIICAGTVQNQHPATPMVFDPTSQPTYRLEDQFSDTGGLDHSGLGASPGHHQTQSQLQLAARQAPAPGTAAATLAEPATDLADLFGGL